MPQAKPFDLAVIGAGIARSSPAYRLAPRRGECCWRATQRAGYHASGRSAAPSGRVTGRRPSVVNASGAWAAQMAALAGQGSYGIQSAPGASALNGRRRCCLPSRCHRSRHGTAWTRQRCLRQGCVSRPPQRTARESAGSAGAKPGAPSHAAQSAAPRQAPCIPLAPIHRWPASPAAPRPARRRRRSHRAW